MLLILERLPTFVPYNHRMVILRLTVERHLNPPFMVGGKAEVIDH